MRLDEIDQEPVKKVVFAFGRLNPPHYGHGGLIQTLEKVAKEKGANWYLFVSSKNEPEKNPLTYEQKCYWIKTLFPEVRGHLVEDASIKTPLVAATWLYKQGFKSATFVAGEDDMESYAAMIKSGNAHGMKNPDAVKAGKGFIFEPLEFAVSARLASATNARAAVENNDPEAFARAILGPKIGNPKLLAAVEKQLFQTVRQGMHLGESVSEDIGTKLKDLYHHLRYTAGGDEEHKYKKSKYQGKGKPETDQDPYKGMSDFERGHTIRARSSDADHAREFIARRDNPRIDWPKESAELNKSTPSVADLAKKYATNTADVHHQLNRGVKIEYEHTNDIDIATEIAMDHLGERLDYYELLKKLEKSPKKKFGENFADGKGPGKPGDSQRHGIPKKATIAQLEKASHAKGRKGQLARWQLNMRRGKKANEGGSFAFGNNPDGGNLIDRQVGIFPWDVETPKKSSEVIGESIAGKDMLKLFRKMHWDNPGSNSEMDQFIMDHEWGVRMIQPLEIPDAESMWDIDDPFGRIVNIDDDAVRQHAAAIKQGSVDPIIMGPNGSIIDGNHRAQAAKLLNVPIQAYVPMDPKEIDEGKVPASEIVKYVRKIHPEGEWNIDYTITDHPFWTMKSVPISSLHIFDPDKEDVPDPYNRVQDTNLDHVARLMPKIASILKASPIVVDDKGYVLDGNHRALAASKAGMTSIPVWMPAKESVGEVAKVKLSSDPNNFGAWVNDSGKPEKTVVIPTNKIHVFEPDDKFNNPQHAKNLANIVKAIKAGKKLPPILVRRHGIDRFQVVDGHHRFMAYRMAGVKNIPARVIDPKNITSNVEEATTLESVGESQTDYGRGEELEGIDIMGAPVFISHHAIERLDRKGERSVDVEEIYEIIEKAVRQHGRDIDNLHNTDFVLKGENGPPREPKNGFGIALAKNEDSEGNAIYMIKTVHPRLLAGRLPGFKVQGLKRRYSMYEDIQDPIIKPRVYLDMDGVLADFFGEWSRISGVNHYKDIDDVEAKLQLVRDHPTFWIDLPLLPNAKALIQTVVQNYGEYRICSKPLEGDARSEPGKLQWIKKHLSDMPPAEVLLTADKAKFATHDGSPCILVDDYGVNINSWRAAGGIGIKYDDSAFSQVAKILSSIAKSGVPK